MAVCEAYVTSYQVTGQVKDTVLLLPCAVNTPMHTHKHRAGPAKLIWLCTAVRPPCRAAIAVGRGPDHFGQYH